MARKWEATESASGHTPRTVPSKTSLPALSFPPYFIRIRATSSRAKEDSGTVPVILCRIFVTRTDSGGHQFNYSEIFGSGIAAGISTYSYHPKGDRTLPNTASVWGTQVGYDTIAIFVKEFWPDIRRKLQKKK